MSRTNRQAIVETAAMRHARQAKTILRRLEKTIVGAAPEPAVIDTVNAASAEELLGGHQAHARLMRSEGRNDRNEPRMSSPAAETAARPRLDSALCGGTNREMRHSRSASR